MSTDPIPRIRMFTQPVRHLHLTPLVWLAVLSTTAILACKEDPIGPDGTGGRLTITVVPYENAKAEASAAADADSSAAESGPRTTTTRGTARPSVLTADDTRVRNLGPEQAADQATPQAAAAAPPRRDLLRINLSGPQTMTMELPVNPDGSVELIIEDLPEGTYSVELLGIDTDLGGKLVSEYGINNSVTVVSDQTSNAIISFGSFLPVINPSLPAQTSEFAFTVDYSAVPSATGYFFEQDTDPSFSNPTTISTADTSVVINVVEPVANWMRVRAENNNVPAAQAKPSDPVLIDVVIDVNPTGADTTSAPSLGVGRGANGQYGNYNIYPATDEDWFAIDLTHDVTLTVDVLTASLTSPPSAEAGAAVAVLSTASAASLLDPVVDIYDPSLSVIATNDDRDGTTLESRVSNVAIPADGRYYIRVTSLLGGSVGHYELLINVTAESVTLSPTSLSFASFADTATIAATVKDSVGTVMAGATVTWATSDETVATVSSAGLVTSKGNGTATITATSDSVSATAAVRVAQVASSVTLSPTTLSFAAFADTATIVATVKDANDSTIASPTVTWSTSSASVATVSSAGLVTSVADGTTTITVTSGSATATASVTITVWASLTGAGFRHSCAVTTAGAGYCWGDNTFYKLGDGTNTDRTTPTLVSGGYTWASITSGDNSSCGVTTAGAGYCWGNNGDGQVGDGTTTQHLTPTLVSGGYTWASITGGRETYNCGVTTAGAGYCWGSGQSGRLGDGTTTGRLTPTLVSGGYTWASITTGWAHSCGLTTAGAAYCWGSGGNGRLGDGTTTLRLTPTLVSGGYTWASITGGFYHTCGVTTADAAYCWGWNNAGRLGDGTTTDRSTPTLVSGGYTWASITGGASHSCGVTAAGVAYCWGNNRYGQVGDGTTTQHLTPTLVSGGYTTWASITGADYGGCGLMTTGAAYCWGDNRRGQLGNGTNTSSLVPVKVTGPS